MAQALSPERRFMALAAEHQKEGRLDEATFLYDSDRAFDDRDLFRREVVEFINQLIDLAVKRGAFAFIEVLVALRSRRGELLLHLVGRETGNETILVVTQVRGPVARDLDDVEMGEHVGADSGYNYIQQAGRIAGREHPVERLREIAVDQVARFRAAGWNATQIEGLNHEAVSEAIRDWVTNVHNTFYCIGTVAGPHPYPMMVRDFQSVIGRECLEQMPDGPIMADVPSVTLPPKQRVFTNLESMIQQFKLFSQGFDAPPGEIYCGTEAHKGELGFYIVSTGGGKPYRLKIRAPSFIHMGAFDHMSRCVGIMKRHR